MKSVYRERDPAGTINIGYNEGGNGDEKSVAKTQMVKTVRIKADCISLF